MEAEIKNSLASGQLARLIPTVSDSKKEERATSSLLASFMVVPSFAKEVLTEIGASIGTRTDIDCYTEVVFKSTDGAKSPRPDGLIVIRTGSKKWTALVESKVGNAILTTEQIEQYLDLAKTHHINAVITISNQFVTAPSHHPVTVSKQKLRNVDLYHFSWMSLVSKAILITDNKIIKDPEQAYILSELIRYFRHDSSGVTSLISMDGSWKLVCNEIQQGAVLSKASGDVGNAAKSWQQLVRHLSLNLSILIGQPVSIFLSKNRAENADLNFSEDCSQIVTKNSLEVEFTIPNASTKVHFLADFLRRTINFSMKLEAPRDKSRATACINWLTKQLRDKDNVLDLTIRAHWPKRTPMTTASLRDVIDSPNCLIPDGINDLPKHLEVVRVIDLMSRFKGSRTFVEECSNHFPAFYHDVGQHLTKWVARAPKVKEVKHPQNEVPTILSEPDLVNIFNGNSEDDKKQNNDSSGNVFMNFINR